MQSREHTAILVGWLLASGCCFQAGLEASQGGGGGTCAPGTAAVAGSCRPFPAPMPMPGGVTVAASPDGGIYVLLDEGSRGIGNLYRYDPASNAWATLAPQPNPRNFVALACAPDGRLVAMGGSLGTAGGASVAEVDVYDPGSNNWSAGPDLPEARDAMGAATGPDGRIYAIGGEVSGPDYVATGLAEALDVSTGSWAALPTMPTSADTPAVVTGLDGRIYAFAGAGGTVSAHYAINSTQSYDPVAQVWTNLPPVPTPRFWPAAAVGSDGRIYVIAGADGSTYPGQPLGDVEAYDPGTQVWSIESRIPTARLAAGAAAAPGGNPLFVFGGVVEADYTKGTADAEALWVPADAWW